MPHKVRADCAQKRGLDSRTEDFVLRAPVTSPMFPGGSSRTEILAETRL